MRKLDFALLSAFLLTSAAALPAQTAVANPPAAQTAPATNSTPPRHLFFHVQLPKDRVATSGRLLVFIENAEQAKAEAGPEGKVTSVQSNPFHITGTSVAARNVDYLTPGATVDIDTDSIAFPAGFSALPAGEYDVQVLLDVNRDYNYHGPSAGDLISDVASVHLDNEISDGPTLTLSRTIPATDPWDFGPRMPKQMAESAKAAAIREDFASKDLTDFWGRPVVIKGWVLLPPGYKEHPQEKYPTVYFTHGYGANIDSLTRYVAVVHDAMQKKEMPPMIWIFLDESSPTGTHEFADSVNNGPWGQALTTEFIPYFESKYRTDGTPASRFLNGHSSGGWATLWLQVRYPKVFGGSWPTSPDPSDFHDFTGVDLYAPHANLYHRPDGTPYPLIRDKGKVLANMETFARFERVIGPYGGQLASFEWVFSPRGKDGAPEKMFNRDTGDIDPTVVAYWRDHYDIAYMVQQNWPTLKPDLDGKIHLIVGTADTFYLDGAAHKLQAVFESLGANESFRFLPDKTHMDLYVDGADRWALLKKISWEMYAIARPGSKPPAAATPKDAAPAAK